MYTIEFLFNAIKQKIVLVLSYNNLQKVLIRHKKIFSTDWDSNLTLSINGLAMDDVWSGFIEQIGSFTLKDDSLDYTVDQQIKIEELLNEQTKLKKKLNSTKTGRIKVQIYAQLVELSEKISKIKLGGR